MGFGVRFAKAMPYFQKERAIPKTESMVVHRRQYMLQFFMLIAVWWGVIVSQSDPFTSRYSFKN